MESTAFISVRLDSTLNPAHFGDPEQFWIHETQKVKIKNL